MLYSDKNMKTVGVYSMVQTLERREKEKDSTYIHSIFGYIIGYAGATLCTSATHHSDIQHCYTLWSGILNYQMENLCLYIPRESGDLAEIDPSGVCESYGWRVSNCV
jgi:hypothetical protein